MSCLARLHESFCVHCLRKLLSAAAAVAGVVLLRCRPTLTTRLRWLRSARSLQYGSQSRHSCSWLCHNRQGCAPPGSMLLAAAAWRSQGARRAGCVQGVYGGAAAQWVPADHGATRSERRKTLERARARRQERCHRDPFLAVTGAPSSSRHPRR
eukprot:6182348-Pleurochrysis_carterae.AAC.1